MNPLHFAVGGLEDLYRTIEEQMLRHPDMSAGDVLPQPGTPIFDIPMEQSAQAGQFVRILASEWKCCKPGSKEHALMALRIDALRATADRILELVKKREKEYTRLQRTAHQSLESLEAGSKYFESIAGYRENLPRFIDAHQ